MKTVDLSIEILSLKELLQLATEDNLILKTNDGQEFVLAQLDDFDQEIALMHENKELMAFLEERFIETKGISLDEVMRSLDIEDV